MIEKVPHRSLEKLLRKVEKKQGRERKKRRGIRRGSELILLRGGYTRR